MTDFINCEKKTYLTKKGVNFPKNAKIHVDHNGNLYYEEHDERYYLNENFNCKNPTVMVGTTTTLPEGSDSFVENVGTNKDSILNFNLSKGDKGPIGPEGPKGKIGLTGSPSVILLSSSFHIYLSSLNIKNSADVFISFAFCYNVKHKISLVQQDQITNSSINDTFTIGNHNLESFIMPRNGYITYANFFWKPFSPAIVPSGTASLITRFYISSPNNGIFKPLNGTSTDVVLSNSIIDGDENLLSSNTGDISVSVTQGDILCVILFLTSSENGVVSTFDGIISGGVSIS